MIRPLIIVPLDPFSEKIGGIRTFVSDFIRFAPEDFAPEVVGCTGDPVARPVGRWQSLDIDGRPVQFLPVLSTPDVNRRPTIPLSLQFTLAAVLRREAHRFRGRILQFHHPGVPAGFLAVGSPRILVVHLNVADIDSGAGESRWARLPGLLHRFEDVTLPRMDRIFLVNRDGLEFYRKRHPAVADRSAFLPTSVDQDPSGHSRRRTASGRASTCSGRRACPRSPGTGWSCSWGVSSSRRTRSCWWRRLPPRRRRRATSGWSSSVRGVCVGTRNGAQRSAASPAGSTGSATVAGRRCPIS